MTLFMGFIVYLVVVLTSHQVDLESDDYYLREIAYEQEIVALNAGAKNDAITINQNQTHIVVQLPATEKFTDVMMELKRPNDNQLDRSYSIKGTNTFTLLKSELTAGQYNIEFSYRANNVNCLQKTKIYI